MPNYPGQHMFTLLLVSGGTSTTKIYVADGPAPHSTREKWHQGSIVQVYETATLAILTSW